MATTHQNLQGPDAGSDVFNCDGNSHSPQPGCFRSLASGPELIFVAISISFALAQLGYNA